MAKAILRVICWWFGCRPDYEHGEHNGPNYRVPCGRCGAYDTTYNDRVNDTRHERLLCWLHHWLYRRWWPQKCQCGKRWKHHETDECLPF